MIINFQVQMKAVTLILVSKMMHCTWMLVMKAAWVIMA